MPTPFAECRFVRPNVTDTYRPQHLRVIQREYKHDMAVAVIRNETGDSASFRTGVPVWLSWGWEPQDIGHFYGYVHQVKPIHITSDDGTDTIAMRVIMLGTSMIYKERAVKVYEGRSITSLMIDFAERAKFSGDLQWHDRTWDALVWRGVTQWKFMVSLAERIGWSLYVHQTELRFHDRSKSVLDQKDTAPMFEKGTNLFTFIPTRGDDPEGTEQRATRRLYALDSKTLATIDVVNDADISQSEQLGLVSTDPAFDSYEFDLFPRDLGEATELLRGRTYANRWHIRATAEVLGVGRFHQASLALLLGVSGQDNGYWFVPEVEHEYDESDKSYRMKLTLGRDSTGDTGEWPANPGTRVIRKRLDPMGTEVAAPAPTTLVNGVWRSAWNAQRRIVGV